MEIILISNSIITLEIFLDSHIKELYNRGFKISIISKLGSHKSRLQKYTKNLHNINFSRNVSIFNDLKSLIQLFFILKKNRKSIVISITPKAGFLTALCKIFINFRKIHYFTGQVWATKKGLYRYFLKLLDKIIIKTSQINICDGASQHSFMNEELDNPKNLVVLGCGSIKGVDLKLFKKDLQNKKIFRKKLNIPQNAIVGISISRLNKDKGILELPNILNPIFKNFPNFYFILIGKDEGKFFDHLKKNLLTDNFLYFEDTNEPYNFINASDLSLITSYREGFCNFALESSASGVPVICKDIYGIRDAVINNFNGFYYKNFENSYELITKLINDRNISHKTGNNGITHSKNFSNDIVLNIFVEFIIKFNEKYKIY
tara:strand:+ start:27037 stop:28161 length:1125 start_codon:yes stop_codon:yes gene_type:complete